MEEKPAMPDEDNSTALDTTADTDTTDTETTDSTTDAVDQADESTTKDDTDWKAMARKHEARAKENAGAAKELAALKRAQMNDQQKAEAAATEALERAEAAERRAAVADAARKYALTDDDLELLDGVPADKFDAKAKALSERIKAAAPAGSSGGEIHGSRTTSTESDPRKLAEAAAKRRGSFF